MKDLITRDKKMMNTVLCGQIDITSTSYYSSNNATSLYLLTSSQAWVQTPNQVPIQVATPIRRIKILTITVQDSTRQEINVMQMNT